MRNTTKYRASQIILATLSLLFALAGIIAISHGRRVVHKKIELARLRTLVIYGQKMMYKKDPGKVHQAARLFQEINTHYPKVLATPGYYDLISNAYHDLAFSMIRKYQYKTAEKLLREGLVLDPGSINLLRMMGEVYRKQGNRQAALTTLETLYRIKPDKKLKKELKKITYRTGKENKIKGTLKNNDMTD